MQLLGLPKMTDKSTLSTLVLTSCYLQCYSLAMKMPAKFKNTKTICILSLQTPIYSVYKLQSIQRHINGCIIMQHGTIKLT